MDKNKRTGYEWCLEENIRVKDIENWPRRFERSAEKGYFLTDITRDEFLKYLTKVVVKHDSTPRKTEMFLELRMYSLVPYNLMGIQKGIQHEHSVTQYVAKHVLDTDEPCELYKRWAKEWKTAILLNGGTSNTGHWVRHGFREVFYEGSMQAHLKTLQKNNIKLSFFEEPDLNSELTGISFIVDERVFNRELYPDFVNSPYPWADKGRNYKPKDEEVDKWEAENNRNYEAWCEKIGGEKNVFLRDFLKPSNFKLA
jgi:hypothetical protein